MPSTTDKINQLTTKIKEKEEESNNLSVDAFNLRGEREALIVKLMQEEKILAQTNWELKFDSNNYYLEFRDPPGGKMDVIVHLSNNDYHSWFDMEDGIRIQFDDSALSITFEEPKQLMPFVKNNKMKVTGTGILDKLAKLKREASTLEEVCHTFGITK